MQSLQDHLRQLQRRYDDAPANQRFGATARVREGKATVTLKVSPEALFPRDSADTAVLFKAVHDAAYLAASSLVLDGALITTRFELDVSGAAREEEITAMGRAVSSTSSQVFAEARLFSSSDEEVACGEGHFSHSNVALLEQQEDVEP